MPPHRQRQRPLDSGQAHQDRHHDRLHRPRHEMAAPLLSGRGEVVPLPLGARHDAVAEILAVPGRRAVEAVAEVLVVEGLDEEVQDQEAAERRQDGVDEEEVREEKDEAGSVLQM